MSEELGKCPKCDKIVPKSAQSRHTWNAHKSHKRVHYEPVVDFPFEHDGSVVQIAPNEHQVHESKYTHFE